MAARLMPATVEGIEAALRALREGGLVAFPTDTVYGLAAALHDQAAIERIYVAKSRPKEKAIPVLLGDADQLPEVAELAGEMAILLAGAFWPGPLTLVLPRKPGLPDNLGPEDSVGVRVPDHPFALQLLRGAGPLAVTSANRSGAPSARIAGEVEGQIGDRIELILDGGRTPGGEPSTVVDCRGGELEILRHGPLSEDDLRSALK